MPAEAWKPAHAQFAQARWARRAWRVRGCHDERNGVAISGWAGARGAAVWARRRRSGNAQERCQPPGQSGTARAAGRARPPARAPVRLGLTHAGVVLPALGTPLADQLPASLDADAPVHPLRILLLLEGTAQAAARPGEQLGGQGQVRLDLARIQGGQYAGTSIARAVVAHPY